MSLNNQIIRSNNTIMQAYIGLTMQTIGSILIAFSLLQLFQRVTKKTPPEEGKKDMRIEQILGAIAIVFFLVGFALQITAV